ncbi:hypothetical protein J7E73_20465 [Paenibacillus albidus]|uniref:hypothetical protein n=1 Tax=Paenibacillus albidus TaxID=2041023 RepID=UPI001BE8B0F0|nr:hypothetical protein [Paenibacillus albidus]MBT2291453.1 hypothetical protein [Paenibacillus albidus]
MIMGTWNTDDFTIRISSDLMHLNLKHNQLTFMDYVVSITKVSNQEHSVIALFNDRASTSLRFFEGKVIYPSESDIKSVQLVINNTTQEYMMFISRRNEPYAIQIRDRPNFPYFHKAYIAMDIEPNINNVITSIQTHAHPNYPPDLPNETLSIEDVYYRAGIDLRIITNHVTAPINPASGKGTPAWSYAELNDALLMHFDRKTEPSERIWLFQAAAHEDPTLLGVKFDSADEAQRQGLVIFNQSFTAPIREEHPDEYIDRDKFRTTVHGLGHCFDLSHSFSRESIQWLPVLNDKNSYSFMNYPHKVDGGTAAYFRNFRYIFTPEEKLFLRHAPEQLMEPVHSDTGVSHDFKDPTRQRIGLKLRITAYNHPNAEYEFLEPVHIKIELYNVSNQTLLINKNMLEQLDDLSLLIQSYDGTTKKFRPFVHPECKYIPEPLENGQCLSKVLFISAGSNGWYIDKPGVYVLQLILQINQDVHLGSNLLNLQVLIPTSREEEQLAQDFFTRKVANILSVKGSYSLKATNDFLSEVAERLPSNKVAAHILMMQLYRMARPYKLLSPSKHIKFIEPDINEIQQLWSKTSEHKNELKQLLGEPTWKQIEALVLTNAGRE